MRSRFQFNSRQNNEAYLKPSKLDYKFNLGVLTFIASSSLFASTSYAAAKGAPSAPSCGTSPSGPALTTPTPVRKVVLRPIGTKAFQLPNGSAVNLSADLQSMEVTAVTSTPSFSPTDETSYGPCNSHLEIRAAVTNFQLDVANVGVSFGYNNSSVIDAGASITGKADVKVGTISMDFSVWDCVGNQCSAVAADTETQATVGVNLSLQIDFSSITTGPSLVYNTPLGNILKTMMLKGMSNLAASSRLIELPWEAQVKDYIPSAGLVIFDAGVQSRIANNQAFEIYAPTDASAFGTCNVYKTVAYVHTTSVNTVSSTALVDQIMSSSRDIQPGDVVMIRSMGQ